MAEKRSSQTALARLLEEIKAEARATRRFTGRDAFSDQVMDAVGRVPRERFVPAHLRTSAYENRPLPIGHGQTISQPYMVALMTDLLDLEPDHRVLEIGTGCGYQTAILATLVADVYTVEIVSPLAEKAVARLRQLGFENVHERIGDGNFGWPEYAPFDAVIVTAAAPEIPASLVEQLKPGGRMIIPVGTPYSTQDLLLLEKDKEGEVYRRSVLPVAFVPLTGEHPN